MELKPFGYICLPKSLKKNQQIGYLIQQAKIVLAAIGERGVMKTKILGIALMVSLAAVLGACEGGGGGTGESTPTTTTTGEPTDTGATTPPTTISPTTTATPTTTP